MSHKVTSILDPKKRYLQVALNSTLHDARLIISQLPKHERILVEVGTPLIKEYGAEAIRKIKHWYTMHVGYASLPSISKDMTDIPTPVASFLSKIIEKHAPQEKMRMREDVRVMTPYVVADLKTMDRAEHEVRIAASAGASAAIALGSAPLETLNSFVAECEAQGIDAMIDMMNVEYPLTILHALKKKPPVIILHRGVDEEKFNKEKQIPLYEIRRIKGAYDVMISIAGGDTVREVQRAIFNDADIVVIWKSVYQSNAQTVHLVEEFLREIK